MALPGCSNHLNLCSCGHPGLAPWAFLSFCLCLEFCSVWEMEHRGLWNLFLLLSTLDQETDLNTCASTIQPWCPAVTTTVMVYLVYFPLFLWKLSLWWSVPLGLTPSAPEVTQGTQGLTAWHFTSFLTSLLSVTILTVMCLSFRAKEETCLVLRA